MPSSDVRGRARAAFAAQEPGVRPGLPGLLDRVCCATTQTLGSDGAAVTLSAGPDHDDVVRVVAGWSDDLGCRAAELELDVGVGPSSQALVDGRPVLVPEIGAQAGWRWPAWDSRATEAGVGAVHAFPMQLGAARFGVLAAFHARPLRLVPAVTALGMGLATLTTELLLDRAARTDITTGQPALGADLDLRVEVYQAQGMVMSALGLTMADALARMRAHAFAGGRDLPAVAADIVAGRLELPPEGTR